MTFFGVFKPVEIGVVVTSNKNCFAISGNRAAVVDSYAVVERNIAVAEKESCVDLAVIDDKFAELLVILWKLNFRNLYRFFFLFVLIGACSRFFNRNKDVVELG